MAKTVSKKASTKKAAPKKIGHFKMELYDNESVEVDVDGPNSDLVESKLLSIRLKNNLPVLGVGSKTPNL